MTEQNRCILMELYGSHRGITRGVLLLTIWFPYLLVLVSQTWIGFAISIFAPFKCVHIGPILPIWGHVELQGSLQQANKLIHAYV